MAPGGGRKSTPTAIKIAKGTVRARDQLPLQPVGEAVASVPKPPKSLKATGKAKWKEWGQRLLQLKLLETRYLDALEMYCRAWDRLAEYEKVLNDQGEFFIAESGYVGRHPAANGAKQARDEIRRYQQEFGLTPSSAASVKVTKKADGADKRKRFFGNQA